MSRVISWFSCGAASAYATYLVSKEYPDLKAVYCRVAEESEDNLRFLNDFENATGIKVEIIGSEKHNYSIYEVFKERKFIKGQTGAPCTMVLKKNVRKAYQMDDDLQIFGYTCEEEHRANRFIDSNNEVDTYFPLIEKGINKDQCKQFILDMGIELPMMYKLGYGNNNCIGCVKGGMGYWNAIRNDFPDHFSRMSKMERELNHALLKDKDGAVFLDELEPNRGNFKRDLPGDCGFTCEWQMDLFKDIDK